MEYEAIHVEMLSLEQGEFEAKNTIDATAQELLLGDQKLHIQLNVPFAIADKHYRISGKIKQIIHIEKNESSSFKAFMAEREKTIFVPLLERMQQLVASVTKEVWQEEQNWQFSVLQRNPQLHVVEDKTRQ